MRKSRSTTSSQRELKGSAACKRSNARLNGGKNFYRYFALASNPMNPNIQVSAHISVIRTPHDDSGPGMNASLHCWVLLLLLQTLDAKHKIAYRQQQPQAAQERDETQIICQEGRTIFVRAHSASCIAFLQVAPDASARIGCLVLFTASNRSPLTTQQRPLPLRL